MWKFSVKYRFPFYPSSIYGSFYCIILQLRRPVFLFQFLTSTFPKRFRASFLPYHTPRFELPIRYLVGEGEGSDAAALGGGGAKWIYYIKFFFCSRDFKLLTQLTPNSTSDCNLFRFGHLWLRFRHFSVLSVLKNSTCTLSSTNSYSVYHLYCCRPIWWLVSGAKNILAMPLRRNNVWRGITFMFFEINSTVLEIFP